MSICENSVLEEHNELEVFVVGKLNELVNHSNYVKHNYKSFFTKYKNYFSKCNIADKLSVDVRVFMSLVFKLS